MLDTMDKRLLNALQGDFPLHSEPFSKLGAELGMDADEVLDRIRRLKQSGIVRHIGPIFDARKLGYTSTLAALQLPDDRLYDAAGLISQHPGVTHNYSRNHKFNLWFTLTLPHRNDLDEEVRDLGQRVGAEAALNLPALRVFKLRTYFDATGEKGNNVQSNGHEPLTQAMELSAVEKAVTNEVQQDLPLVSRPFDQMAQHVAIDATEFVEICRSLKRRGVMRRFGGTVKHDRIGFVANAMTCWAAPKEAVGPAGNRLASFPEVSHCYERRTNEMWPYNLFAMIHGHQPQDCRKVAERVSGETGLGRYQMLSTVKEFKKARGRYPV
jgi:DNA-binding Lrp family transcriptional regulator